MVLRQSLVQHYNVINLKLKELSSHNLPRPVETSKLGLTQQPVEDVSHLVEERNYIIVPHQCRLVGGRLGEIRNHGSERVAAFTVGEVVAREEGPYSGMRVFSGYLRIVLEKCIEKLRL